MPTITLGSWLVFCVAAAFYYDRELNTSAPVIWFILAGIAPVAIAKFAIDLRARWWPRLWKILADHTRRLDSISAARNGPWIALAAGTGLYLELVLIRYHGTCFAIFGFFKNLSLISCFLGLGIGYALGRLPIALTPLVLPMLALQLLTMHLLRYVTIGWVLENPISEELAMGLGVASGVAHVSLVYAFLVWTFSLNALCLIPLGQLASHLMGRSRKLPAYSWNLAGSIAAVLVFWGLSFVWSPPVVWFAVAFLALAPLLRGLLASWLVTSTIVLGIIGTSLTTQCYDVYSPYQILTVFPVIHESPVIMVNHFFYQAVLNLGPGGPSFEGHRDDYLNYYGMPYQFCQSPRDVMIVGAGSGNDVAAALRHGAGHIDAVEIDPAILSLGRTLHPEMPYQSDRVTATVQDARAFVRFTRKQYDLIVYGLLDSHTALSGLSGVRLDSYIYTVEAFRQARSRLKDNGVLCLSFAVSNMRFGHKIFDTLATAFDGQSPHVYRMSTGAMVFVLGKNSAIAPPPDLPGATDITDQVAVTDQPTDTSTDDWPFFYMPARTYPVTYLVMIVMLLAVAVAFTWPVVKLGGGGAGVSIPCLLLGAGFMLLETKAITELALFYGSTWIVVSIVILAILIMAFFANLLVMRWPGIPRTISYLLLLLSLAASLWFSTSQVSLQSEWTGRIIATAVLTLPLFFSGLVFSAEMNSAASVASALGSNLIGAMIGGCLEYNSMYFGYRSLYILAMAIYAASMIVSLVKRLKGKSPVPEPLVAS